MNVLSRLLLGFAAISLLFCLAGGSHSRVRNVASGERVQAVSREETFWSDRLQRPIPYWVFKPAHQPEEVLPVVYFLHGLGESHLWFESLGGKTALEDHLMRGGQAFAVVALMGREGSHNYYWLDEAGSEHLSEKPTPWASMLIKDLAPAIEKKHNIGGSKSQRAIAGISMGSAGAFQLAFNNPDQFECVAGHSLVLRTATSAIKDFPLQFGNPAEFKKRDPVSLAGEAIAKRVKPFGRAWIDLGGRETEERLSRAREFRSLLLAMGMARESLDVGEKSPLGEHNLDYWTSNLPGWISWYSQCFK